MSDLETIRQVAKSWELACRSANAEAITAHLSEDAKIWYNFEGVEHNLDSYRKILDASYLTFKNPKYHNFRVLHHEGGFIEQAVLEGETAAGIVSSPFCIVATVKNGKITRLEEYFNSTGTPAPDQQHG